MRAATVGLAARRLLGPGGGARLGEVHSVFRRVVNVMTPPGRLISFSTVDVSPAPASVVTDLSPSVGWVALGVVPGASAVLEGAAVEFEGVTARIEGLDGAVPFVPRIGRTVRIERARIGAMIERAVESACATRPEVPAGFGLRELLPHVDSLFDAASPKRPRFDSPFCEAAYRHMADLVRAIRVAGGPLIREAARGLAGLGPGLTPSGDDALAGLLAALALTGRGLGRERLVLERINPLIVEEVLGTTGILSTEMLRYASAGQGNAGVEDAVAAILGGDEGIVATSVARLCEIGASSGVDQLWGALVGIRLGLEVAEGRTGFRTGAPRGECSPAGS